MGRADSLEKGPDAKKDWGQEEKGTTGDEMVGWYHWLNGQEFEQTPGDSEGQGSLACCSPWGGNSSPWTWLNHWTTTIIHTCACVCACVSSNYPEPTDGVYGFPYIEATHPYTSFSGNSLLPKHPKDICPGAHSISLVWKSSIFLRSFIPAFYSGPRSSLTSLQWLPLPFSSYHTYFHCHLFGF